MLTFNTIDDIEEYFSESKHNDVKYPFALGKKKYFLHVLSGIYYY